jgi:hypothetical protein
MTVQSRQQRVRVGVRCAQVLGSNGALDFWLLIAISHSMPDTERPAELSGFAEARFRKKGRKRSEMRKKMAGIREERR